MEKTKKYAEVLNNNVQAIRSIVASVRGTIGPKGMDVMIVDEFGNFICTNDGVEILSNIQISHPAAKLAVEAAKSQEMRVGDGTTTAAILCDSLLASALLRINSGAQPTRVARGIEIATQVVIEELTKSAKKIKDVNDPKLRSITNISARGQEDITELIIEAAQRTMKKNSSCQLADSIIVSTGMQSAVLDGLFIKKKTHFNYIEKFKDVRILVLEGPLEPEPMSSEAVSTDEGVRKYERNIQTLMETVKRISKSGVKAIFTSSSILAAAEELFVREGVFVLSHLKQSDINHLVNISGAKLSTRTKLLNSDIDQFSNYSGTLTLIEHKPELSGFIFQGKKAYQASILISAETDTVLEERGRIATDAAKALSAALRSGYVMGEGVAEMNITDNIEKLREAYPNDKDISAGIEIVVEALKSIFLQITENAGFSPNDIYYKFRPSPTNTMGIDLETGETLDLEATGILDPLEVKVSAFKIASEIAIQILKINMVVQGK
jgi:chaperonin GroEL (HSP60 family)